MNLRELKAKVNAIDPKFDDCRVMVDTDACAFKCHMVDIDNVWCEDSPEWDSMPDDRIYLSLDEECKLYSWSGAK
jgi:hypothetical protein